MIFEQPLSVIVTNVSQNLIWLRILNKKVDLLSFNIKSSYFL